MGEQQHQAGTGRSPADPHRTTEAETETETATETGTGSGSGTRSGTEAQSDADTDNDTDTETEQSDAADGQGSDGGGELVLGLVADPGLASDLVDAVGQQLPERIAEWSGEREPERRWRVETSSQLVPLDTDGALPLLEIGRRQRRENGWDLTIVLTDLPRRISKRPVLADCHPESGVGLVSLPATGAFRVHRRTRDTIAHLVVQHLWGRQDRHAQRSESGSGAVPGPGVPFQLITDSEETGASAEETAPGGQVDAQRQPAAESRHLALPGRRRPVRLLTGMVRANRPWRLIPSLSPALAGAAAGAAFGIFYSNIWQLADAFSTARLALVNAIAVLAMIAWLIFDNNLWENPRNRRLRTESALYNTVTLLTISLGVACMYVLLFSVTLLAALVTIPLDYLGTTLGRSATVADQARVAWLSASMGTIAGSLGSGLAGEEAVRQAAYSEREQERQARREAEEERTDREATRAEENES